MPRRSARRAWTRDALNRGASFSPAFALLAAACRWPPAVAADAEIAALACDADWPAVLALVRRHRVQGLLLPALGRAGVAAPPSVAAALRDDAFRLARRALGQAAASVALARALDARSIPNAILKGAPLALLAYGGLTRKHAWDIDLLVEPSRFPDAAAILREQGFRPSFAFHDAALAGRTVDGDELLAWAARAKETIWHREADGAVVELHTRLTDSPGLLAGVDARSPLQRVTVDGLGELPTLADPELYAYLAVHGASHGWERLKWLADLCAFLAGRDEAALRSLHARAAALGAALPSAQALLLGHQLGLLALPATLAADLSRSRRARALVALARRVMTGHGAREPQERRLGTVPIHLSQFLLSADPTYLSRLVAAKLNPTTDAVAKPLPRALRPLQPLVAVPRWLLRRSRAGRDARRQAAGVRPPTPRG